MSKVINLSFLILLFINVKAKGSHVIPFELVGNLIIISAIVDGKEGNYIVDTGVPIVYLNKNYFAGKISDKVMHGINGEGSEVSTRYSEIEIAGSVWKSIYAEIINLESIEQALGKSVHGLLGCRLFRRHMIEFDYAKMELTMSLPDKDTGTSGHREDVNTKIIPFKFRGRIPVIDARLGSLDLSLIVDTGSATNILGEESLKNLTANSIKWDKQRLTGFGKTEIKADAGTIFDLEIGEIVCQPMKTLFCEEKKFQSLCPGQTVQGVLGYEFLKQVHTTINFKEKTIAFRNVNSARNSDLAAKRDTLGGPF